VRPSWDDYFMDITFQVAKRSTCDRARVGSIIVKERRILTTGYNGAPAGLPHCDEVGHLMENNHCVATIHAEANAIVQAARNGVQIKSASIYITASPCWSCFKLIANVGIQAVYYGEFYRDERIFEVAKTLGIQLTQVKSAALDLMLET